jgi:hypothetical protein
VISSTFLTMIKSCLGAAIERKQIFEHLTYYLFHRNETNVTKVQK